MKCKNCDNRLRTDYSYCPDCGGRVIQNRLTIKNLWLDIIERYFNLDNTFIKTFLHLFSQPDVVIEGYLNGMRRKYLNPISYLGISITLSGFLILLIKKAGDKVNMDIFGMGTSAAQAKMMDIVYDYQALMFILFIPMMAIAGWLCFQQKGYNFSERVVIFIYTLAHYSISIFIPACLVILFIPQHYGFISLTSLAFMYLYAAYIIKSITEEKGVEFWAKTLVFWVLFSVMYFGLSFFIMTLMLISGQINLEEFKPVKN